MSETGNSRGKKVVKWALIWGLVGFIGIQFIPVNRSNPPVVSEPNWDSPATRAYAQRACFDCHSHKTNWPWYAYVAPVSWFVADHVNEARKELNMSAWKLGDGDEAAKEVREGSMPLWQYKLLHSEARLTDAETQEFISGLVATFGEEKKGRRKQEHETDEDEKTSNQH
ncbi:MAG: heme-binding domain-containing protein [bacterium]